VLVCRREIELRHYSIDFIYYYGVVCCLEVYEEMMSCDVEFAVILLPANSWFICLTETLLGIAVLSRLRIRIIGDYAVLW
jgi:hypothetical protein